MIPSHDYNYVPDYYNRKHDIVYTNHAYAVVSLVWWVMLCWPILMHGAGLNLWPNVVHQSSQDDSNLCIMYQIWLDSVHSWIKLCVMHQYGLIQHAYHIMLCPLTFLLLCLRLLTLEKKIWRKSRFAYLPVHYFAHYFGRSYTFLLPAAAIKKDR